MTLNNIIDNSIIIIIIIIHFRQLLDEKTVRCNLLMLLCQFALNASSKT